MKNHISSTREVYSLVAASLIYSSSVFAAPEQETFSVKLHLMKPITITQTTELSFNSVVAGDSVDLKTTPTDSNAVRIAAGGEPNAAFQGTVVEDSVLLETGDGIGPHEKILVDAFSLGGDMNSGGNGYFNEQGEVENLRIGATAHVNAKNIPGRYVSTATFRLNYL